MKRRITAALMASAIAGALCASPAAAAVAAQAPTCEGFLASQVDASQEAIERTCSEWQRRSRHNPEIPDVPTIAFAWADVGVLSADGQAGLVGWPISATCVITG